MKIFDENSISKDYFTDFYKTSDSQMKKEIKNIVDLSFLTEQSGNSYFMKNSKHKILNAIDSTKKAIEVLQEKERVREKTGGYGRNKSNSLRALQEKNIKRIRQEERKKELEAFKQFKEGIKVTNSPDSKGKKGISRISDRFCDAKNHQDLKEKEQNSNSEIILKKLHKRIERSTENHFVSIENKKKLVLKHWERAKTVVRNNSQSKIQESKLLKLIEKNDEIQKRKKDFLQQILDKMHRTKAKKEEKSLRKDENLKNNERKDKKIKQKIEERIKKYGDYAFMIKNNLKQEQKLKFDRFKSKEIEVSNKLEKSKEKR